MTKETLVIALEAERLKIEPDGIVVPEDREATFILATPGESIQVGRVVQIELRDTCLGLRTAKQERYWFTYDLVLGLRFTANQPAKEHMTGFGR